MAEYFYGIHNTGFGIFKWNIDDLHSIQRFGGIASDRYGPRNADEEINAGRNEMNERKEQKGESTKSKQEGKKKEKEDTEGGKKEGTKGSR